MGLIRFDICFDNADATYYGGQTVSGRLFLHLDSIKRIRGIQVQIRGDAEVKWTETRHVREAGGKVVPSHEYFRGHELYFDNRYYILGGSGSETVLQPGDHSYPFSAVLAEKLPCSYEGRYGQIRYIVKATLERPWKYDHVAKAAFTVVDPVDLNLEPILKTPIFAVQEKWLGCLCLRSGPIGLSMRAPATGVVPGQKLPLKIEMENSTQKTVNRIFIELAQVATFHANEGSNVKIRADKVHVASVELGTLEPRSHRGWENMFQIPALPPSRLNCKIIEIEYTLSVKAEMYEALKEVIVSSNLVIGTIPLKQFWPTLSPIPLTPVAVKIANTMEIQAVPAETPSPYPELPPPSYEESVQGTQSIRDESDGEYLYGCLEFAPRYPTYNFDD